MICTNGGRHSCRPAERRRGDGRAASHAAHGSANLELVQAEGGQDHVNGRPPDDLQRAAKHGVGGEDYRRTRSCENTQCCMRLHDALCRILGQRPRRKRDGRPASVSLFKRCSTEQDLVSKVLRGAASQLVLCLRIKPAWLRRCGPRWLCSRASARRPWGCPGCCGGPAGAAPR